MEGVNFEFAEVFSVETGYVSQSGDLQSLLLEDKNPIVVFVLMGYSHSCYDSIIIDQDRFDLFV